jgi:hypothetical protein
MKITGKYYKKESDYIIEYNNDLYVRVECEMIGDFHTIKWTTKETRDRDDGPILYYYNSGQGWSDKTGHLNINEPAPELENEFKKLNIIL